MSNRIDVKKTYKLYINGAFPRTESGRTYEIKNAKGVFIANPCLASRKDLREAVVAARAAHSGWNKATAYNRGQILYRIAEMLEGRRAQFVDEIMQVTGVTKVKAEKEVTDSVDRLVAIVHAALTEALGGSGRELDLRERTASILLLGLQGAGKTTTAAKLALRLLRDGRRPLLVAADPRRPAAAEQLALLGAAIGVPVHREPIGTPVAEIGRRALESAKKLGRDLLIIDSSGF